jgi:hypothetical protein
VTTRRDFLRTCLTALGALAAGALAARPWTRAAAVSPVWEVIPAQTWTVGEPVQLDLADYCSNPEHGRLSFRMSRLLPPGLTLKGSVISGTPTAYFPATQFVAIADNEEEGPAPAAPRLTLSPNPCRGPVRIAGEWLEAAPPEGKLQVFSASGRLVYQRAIRMTNGRYDFQWDGRIADGTIVPSGVYMVVTTASSETASARLVVTR